MGINGEGGDSRHLRVNGTTVHAVHSLPGVDAHCGREQGPNMPLHDAYIISQLTLGGSDLSVPTGRSRKKCMGSLFTTLLAAKQRHFRISRDRLALTVTSFHALEAEESFTQHCIYIGRPWPSAHSRTQINGSRCLEPTTTTIPASAQARAAQRRSGTSQAPPAGLEPRQSALPRLEALVACLGTAARPIPPPQVTEDSLEPVHQRPQVACLAPRLPSRRL